MHQPKIRPWSLIFSLVGITGGGLMACRGENQRLVLPSQERSSNVLTTCRDLSHWTAPLSTNQQPNDIRSHPFSRLSIVKHEGMSESKAQAVCFSIARGKAEGN
jgi:hypothetical protein